jgi:hypothetical protein
MDHADDPGHATPESAWRIAAHLLKEPFRPHLDQVLVDHSTLVLHFQRPLADLLALPLRRDDPGVRVPSAPPAYRFARSGEYWTIVFASRTTHLRATHGLVHLHYLLRHPHEDIPALVLDRRVHARTTKERDPEEDRVWELGVQSGAPGLPLLDQEAKASYLARLAVLKVEAAQAQRWGDTSKLAHVEEERVALERALAAGLDHRGRPRLTGDGAERARQRVRKTIHEALEKIRSIDPVLGAHLASSVSTGTHCCYRPLSPLPWTFS